MPRAGESGTGGNVRYAVLGCGTTGYHVALELAARKESVLVCDIDESRVRELREQKFDAVRRDISDPGFLAGLPSFDVAFVLSGNNQVNTTAVRTLRQALPGTHIIARATDPLGAGQLGSAGADLVLYPQQVVARAAIHQADKAHAGGLARKLHSLLAGWEGTLAIVTHNNPDPDAIGSAMALAAIAKSANPQKLKCRIFYDGIIGHQENRTMVNLLDIRMEKLDPEAIQDCSYIALVDSPGPGMNNSLSPRTRVSIIIDHHKDGHGQDSAAFSDIRPGMGATASIISQYLQELDIPVDKNVATGLFYGIRSDTREFRRNVTPQDLANAAFLLPLTDGDILDQIMSPSLSQETLDVLGNAIKNRHIQSGYLFSNVGYVHNRDSLPQAADLLISLEGVNTALVYGITDDAIVISARNRDIRLHIGNVLEEAFGDIGDAGGHPNMAAATIPLSYFRRVRNKEGLLALVMDPLIRRFMGLVGLEAEEGHEV
ncbi:MAG TPA: DHH family phosphoesterase [Methanolinea sp.]|nr:DHH family phosphoesterase [Methanolinea sp.]HOS82818.1 DHH family phosphoesterase [Methanolinea sp.]HPC54433.1 DHH family phosphoesterase [Methanolinea sp.]HQE85260.1 DHH family phosphoesterase [Methanolinea sp.]HQI14186.1 DHH family phosphoesterase [Methanolinea sp.]